MIQHSKHSPTVCDAIHKPLWRWSVLAWLAVLPWWMPATGTETIKPMVQPAIIPLKEQPPAQPGLPPSDPAAKPAAAAQPTEPGVVDPNAPAPPDGATPEAVPGSPPPEDPTTIDMTAQSTVDPAMVPFAAEEEPATESEDETLSTDDSGDWQNTDAENGDYVVGLGNPLTMTGLPSGYAGFSGNLLQGFADGPVGMAYGDGWFDDMRQGLGISVALSTTYDSNPSRGYGGPGISGEDDIYTTLFGTVEYMSPDSTWTYGGRYSGGYNQYFNETELSGYFQQAGASLNYNGGRLTATLRAGIDFGSGANRYYESIVEEIRYNYALNGRYQISRKTSLTADFAQRFTTVSGGNQQDTDSLDLGTSALWKYSPLLEFGPGIRYTRRTQGTSDTRSSIGPTLTVNYDLTRKVKLNARVGMDFASYDNGGSVDPTLFSSINFNYRASQLWSMYLRLLRDSQASYSQAGGFENTWAARAGFNRQIRRAVWSMGMGYEIRTFESTSGNKNNQPDRDYLTIDTSLGMPLFRNTCQGSIFMRYSDQSGGGNQEWDAFQVGFNISRSF